MSLLARPLTYDDLCQMPDDRNRYEIIGGELIVSPSPFKPHQKVSYRLTQLIGDYVDARQLSELYVAPVDVRLSPHNIVDPDLLFIRQDRLGIYGPTGPVEGPPDLVVEIISPSSRTMDQTRKAHSMPTPACRSTGWSTHQSDGSSFWSSTMDSTKKSNRTMAGFTPPQYRDSSLTRPRSSRASIEASPEQRCWLTFHGPVSILSQSGRVIPALFGQLSTGGFSP